MRVFPLLVKTHENVILKLGPKTKYFSFHKGFIVCPTVNPEKRHNWDNVAVDSANEAKASHESLANQKPRDSVARK